MKIKDLAKQLETEINSKIKELQTFAKESEELINKIDSINKSMYEIYKELRPVEYIVTHQNPDMVVLFNSLKEISEK